MKSDWKTASLGDHVDLLTGFPFESSKYSNLSGDVRLLRGDNIGQGAVRWDGAKKWPKANDVNVKQYYLRKGDVVLAMDRPWIEAGLKFAVLTDQDVPALLVQRVARLRGTGVLDTRFLRYLVASSAFTDHILAVQTGTAVPHISAAQICAFKFELPPLSEQQLIANVLGTLDDKIEMNQRVNETLEAVVREVFKSWFVEFDPVQANLERRQLTAMVPEVAAMFPSSFSKKGDDLIPAGWSTGTLADLVEIYDSKRIPLSGRERAERQGPYPYYGATSVMDHVDDFLFNGVYVLVGEDGSVINDNGTPVVQYVWGKFWVNNHAHVLTGKHEFSQEYLLNALRSVNIGPYVTGAVQPKLNQANLFKVPMVLPNRQVLRLFNKFASPLYEMFRHNIEESKTLEMLRDLLLPKLISGEIRLKDTEKTVGAAI